MTRRSQRYWEDVAVGDILPEISDEISYARVVSAPVATLDYFAAHHDPNVARSQGLPNVILSTIQIMGLVDRVVTSWSGPATFIKRRTLSLRRSIVPGSRIRTAASVVGSRQELVLGTGHLCDVQVKIYDQTESICCESIVTVRLPTRSIERGESS